MNRNDRTDKIATVGTFDGVHRGHALVLETMRGLAGTESLSPIAITFDRHPLALIAPERAPGFLSTVEEKCELLGAQGVEPVVLPFNEQLRRQTAYEWMRRLHDRMGVRVLIVGYDNTFGSDGLAMDLADYQSLGDVIGIRVVEAPVLPGVSSSAVRKAVAAGEIGRANEMLGRPYRLGGLVKSGNRLGGKIGFPTANIVPPRGRILPAEGVYAATATLPDGTRRPAAVNIGKRPTIGDLFDPLIEAHILDYDGNLYGERIALDLLERVRGEEKFGSVDELRAQLERDVIKVREICAGARY